METPTIKGFRLSPQQKHLWLLEQRETDVRTTSPYVIQCAIKITGNLDSQKLEIALEKVVNRQEILRSRFHRFPGMDVPLQVIEESFKPQLYQSDWTHLTAEERETKLDAFWQRLKQHSLNVENAQELQIHLIHVGPRNHQLIISLPALYGDTITLINLTQEISTAYKNIFLEEPPDDVLMQYADTAAVLNELIESEETLSGREYWQKQEITDFSGTVLSQFPSPKAAEFSPVVLTQEIPPEIFDRLAKIAQTYKSSTSGLFLTCWQILWGRLSGQLQTTIGVAFNGRVYEELASSLGLLAKYLPVTHQWQDALKFSECLQQIDVLISQHSEWQEYFNWEYLGKQTAYFPIGYEFNSWSLPDNDPTDISFTLERQYACIDRFEIKLACEMRGDSPVAEFHYDANLFSVAEIERLADRYQTLLASIADCPDALIGDLEILSDRERQQLLVEFNQTKTAYPSNQCIHHLFEAQVARSPERTALIFNSQELTYSELNARANQLAHHLQKMGVKPDTLVGICVERSPLMAIAVFGILKAGGAYVPIDPTHPAERKAFILEDTQMPILLTQQSLAEQTTSKASIICLDTDWEAIASEPKENPTSQTLPENLAYTIYTSGSTGKPKGTLIHHRGLVNYLSWCTQAYSIDKGDGTLVHSPLGFDLTITSLFSPLLVGRPVELLPGNRGIETLSQALREKTNLSLVKITPAHLELLGQQLSPEIAADRTRAFIIGGENLLPQAIAFWQQHAPNTMLVNEYGPTETVVGCCIYKVPAGEHYSGSVPIGEPIANTQLYVLDRDLKPVPIGITGELHIGGVGLARGYLNRPDLTAEKFIPNPFSDRPGARLYKTGDLARYQSNGMLECLGRIDNQVKIRGYRIELGEVEAVLSEYPEVKDAVVLAQQDVPGGRLVAYAVVRKKDATIDSLRDFLQQKLPEYMVPSAFVLLEALPLTANGKVDRQTLPVLAAKQAELAGQPQLPSTELERAIARIWQQVLHRETVGIHDNFFDLGGHSLLVAQVHSQLEEILPREITLIELMEYPTIHRLAKFLSETPTLEKETPSVGDRVQKQKEALQRQRQKTKASRTL